jgi:hypothetical protein
MRRDHNGPEQQRRDEDAQKGFGSLFHDYRSSLSSLLRGPFST